MLRRKPQPGPSPQPLTAKCSSCGDHARQTVDSPPVLGATERDSAPERFAFLVVQSPNGEFHRFLIIALIGTFLVLAIFVVLALLINLAVAISVGTAATIAGGRAVVRIYLKHRRQSP